MYSSDNKKPPMDCDSQAGRVAIQIFSTVSYKAGELGLTDLVIGL